MKRLLGGILYYVLGLPEKAVRRILKYLEK